MGKKQVVSTMRQREIMQYVSEYTDTYHYPPTLQEIARWLGVSKTTVAEHVATMQKQGLIDRRRGRARTITCRTKGRV
jgi:repressor LexA